MNMERAIITAGGISGLLDVIALRRNFPLAQVVIIESAPGNTYKGFSILLVNNRAKVLPDLKGDGLLDD